ncbi:MAG: AMP-binding protein, partial [Clostridia bacterium]|nr:AMP-binding protein [Clostridia bacterium]
MKNRAPYRQKQHLQYPEKTMFELVERAANEYPNEPAYEFYGIKTSYCAFIRRIERAARAFLCAGIRAGDAVTICMPNVPQALDCFYAV